MPAPLSLQDLVKRALAQGIAQVEAAGTPTHPLLFDDSGRQFVLVNEAGGVDPMELACQAIRSHARDTKLCALTVDTRVTLADGKKWDAIVVMACERGAEGQVWAQRYVPKGLGIPFRVEGEPEQIGQSKDFITVALQDG